MKKKLISIMMASMSVFMLAACNPAEGGGGGDEWWETTGTLNTDENGNVVYDNIDLRLTTVITGEDKAPFEQLVNQFNAEHRGEINVIVDSIDQASYEQSVASRITNNSNAPDFLLSHQKGHQSFVDNELIQPFNEGMEASGITFDMEDFAPGLAQYTSLGFDDELFGVPVDAQSMIVFYNKDMLNDLGASLPTDRAELLDLCKRAATELNITPIAWSDSINFFTAYVFPTAIVQNGGVFYDTQTYKADWYSSETNRTAFKNAIASLRELIYTDPKLANHNEATSSSLSRFLNNQALFYFATPWTLESVLTSYGEKNGLDRETVMSDYVGGTSMSGWFAMSENENSDKIFGDSHFFAISRTCTDINKKAAICEFVRWFTQTGSIGAEWAQAGHISVSETITSSAEYNANVYITDYMNNFYSGLDNFVCIGNTPFYSDLSTQLTSIVIGALGESDASGDDALIKKAQDNLNSIVDFIYM